MTRYDLRIRLFATVLAALAGYVDAIAFITLGGFFVSFMSGNTTRLGVGLVDEAAHAAMAAGLIGAFVAGVAAGSLTGHAAGGRRRRPAVLLLVAGVLAAAAGLGAAGRPLAAAALMAMAMGAENAVFERDGEVHIGLTYMTGTLVKLGQRIAAALRGGDPLAWTPYLLLWTGLAAGACAGAAMHLALGPPALWPAAAAALLLAGVALRIERAPPPLSP